MKRREPSRLGLSPVWDPVPMRLMHPTDSFKMPRISSAYCHSGVHVHSYHQFRYFRLSVPDLCLVFPVSTYMTSPRLWMCPHSDLFHRTGVTGTLNSGMTLLILTSIFHWMFDPVTFLFFLCLIVAEVRAFLSVAKPYFVLNSSCVLL